MVFKPTDSTFLVSSRSTMSIHWPCDSDSIWSFWMEANLCRFFLMLIYICIAIGDPLTMYQEGKVGISLIGLTLPHYCACPKPWHGFPTSYVLGFFLFFFYCSVSSVKMRGYCLFCWYWWNWWPSLFKLYFNNHKPWWTL